ncbi:MULTISPECIES: alpha-xylosidase [Thermoanaerobacterium]|uniref:alpha-D-xyloside xylohydrolase n=2 Tax=Thermoanaerobacterium TaxID=28895 RepID=W9E7F7_9THEO|nr:MULTISPECIES: alpha-xylosidase [Thermoanaerobacterium]AFK86288.1 glycoside hydrolase family 31 [Thermoanaerobacterium saccharolyticum JW/SL-YS485]ETO37368.1 glycoside hydrolase family protein [Thermoanaerobacterium aotearoense SCUT27]
MKFTDGNWLVREEYKVYGATEVNDYEISDNSVILYVPTFHVNSRGDTLGGPLLTVEISSPMEDVISVKLYHFKGKANKSPKFEINRKDVIEVGIKQDDSHITFTSGNLTAKIKTKGDWSIDFFIGDRRITGTGFKNMAYITSQNGKNYLREQLDLGVDEYIYGLGERFTPFIKNGQQVDIWNRDGGTSSEQAYKNIPLYVTNKGYGVFVNDTGLVSYEIASERVSKVQFSVMDEEMEYFIIGGGTIKDVLINYTSLTGKPSLPPAWSFGLWLTTSFLTNYDEKTVSFFIDEMLRRDIPLSVFHFDCFWMKEFQWCDFEWDSRYFPDPENMLKRLKEKGVKISVWINPYIAQKSKLFAEAAKNGYLLKKANGDVWQWDLWQPGMGIVDFTNPYACQWFSSKLEKLVDMGVDCFKTDFGERIPTDVVYYDGSDPEKMHNYYTFLYNKVVYNTLAKKFGKDKAIVFARSATVGSQQFPVHWGGDCNATYESMAETLRGGLSLSMSGFAFWSHDIAGFESTATPDIYKRWTAFGLLSSHSRLHGNAAYKVPWVYDEEAVDVLRHFTRLKNKLMPYLYSKAYEASITGIPIMRTMVMEFQDDPTCAYIDRQYMLGDSLLVAPIFNEEGIAKYYLPNGKWTNYLNGAVIDGQQWIQEKHGYMSIPLMVRPNTIIATGNIDSRPDYDYLDNVTFEIFQLEDGLETSTIVYGINGEDKVTVIAKKERNSIEVNVNGTQKPWTILLRGIYNVNEVAGASYDNCEFGVRIIPEKDSSKINIILL